MTSSRPPPASANLASPARNHRRPPGPDMTEHLPAGPAPASPAAPARGKPAAGLPAAKKLYIQTHGCQMNEYDSARMADVLAAADGDRKSVVSGKSVSVRVDLGGGRAIKKKNNNKKLNT